MPEVTFYILPTESVQERYLFACKLIEKAYRSGAFPYVLTENQQQSQQLDDLLWTFRTGSFIPHQIHTGEAVPAADAVLIGSINPPRGWQKTLLLNLSAKIPDGFQNIERILEILDNSEETKSQGRLRYKEYQSQGIEITTHNR